MPQPQDVIPQEYVVVPQGQVKVRCVYNQNNKNNNNNNYYNNYSSN